MRWSKTFQIARSLLLLFCLSATSAWGQQVTAAITGTVSDPAGAAISGATVTARDVERGSTTTVESNATGVFNFPRLPIGSYEVRVEAKGFESAVQPPIVLVLNQTARLTFQLKVGTVSETMEVSSEAPQLQTDTTQVSTLIDAKNNDALPLATRNFIQLTLLAPGALSVDPQSMNTGSNVAEEGGRPYINGNREQANNFLLDGIDNNQASENLAGFTPSPDAIAEFNVITQNASAEFGNFNGGIVSASIKSGTNKYHGDLFEFFRNDIFNANKWENGLHQGDPAYATLGTDSVIPTPKVRWNMFGATFGGPIIKNKLFFFVDYQGGRLDHPSTGGTINVLTPAEIGGDFSSLLALRDANGNPAPVQLYNPCATGTGISGSPCQLVPAASRVPFSGNIIPTNMLDPVFTALTTNALYPKSIASSAQTGFGLASNTTGQQYNTDQGDLRIDYNVTSKDHLFGRMSKGYQTDPSTNSIALLGNQLNSAVLDNFGLNWDHNFSPSLLNELRLGLNYVQFANGLTTFDSSVGALGNALGISDGNPAGIDGMPLIGFGGGSITNPGVGSLGSLGSAAVVENFASTVLQLDDVLEYTHGRHNIKAGYQMNQYRINVFYSGNGGELGQLLYGPTFSSNPGNATSGNGAADFALGLPEDVGRGTSTGGWHQRDFLFAGFVQDDWRITDHLTLNLGLRYEARTPWQEINNRQVNVNIATGALQYAGNTAVQGVGSNGFSNGLYNTTYGLPDFQPRIGFAWSPARYEGKTVIRGAFTISSYLEGTGTNLRLTQNPPFTPAQVEANNASTGTPFTSGSAFAFAAPPTGDPFENATMLAWAGTVQPAVAKQWNLTIQQEIAKNVTFQLGYVGQATQHLMVPEWLKQGILNPDGSVTPSPFAGGTNANGTLGPNQFGNVKDTASNGSMNYNALQAVLQQRYSHGLDAQVSYTYSKCMTNNDGYYGTWGANTETTPAANYWQNLYDPNADYAQCYWDSKHVISAYATYELPVGRSKQWGSSLPAAVNAVVGNWSIAPIVSWHTGFPIALYGPDNSGTDSPAPRPDCNAPVQYLHQATSNGYAWMSASSFSPAAPGTFGNCPAQGPVIGPKYTDADISLQKNFPITENMRIQFRADFLNAFNHPNFAHPDNTVGDTTFGLITGTQDARQIQFALKFYF